LLSAAIDIGHRRHFFPLLLNFPSARNQLLIFRETTIMLKTAAVF